MVHHAVTAPAMHVTTTVVGPELHDSAGSSLIEWTRQQHPLAFVRGGDGIVGIGERLRLDFFGVDRFHDAAAAWNRVAASASIRDDVGMPGTGLVAFGSFAFADDSGWRSSLVVPETIVGRRGNTMWITRIGVHPNDVSVTAIVSPPARQSIGPVVAVRFEANEHDAEQYENSVREVLAALDRGEIRKVVLARQLLGAIDVAADLRAPLAALEAAYPDTFVFAIDGMMGASPETMVRVIDGRVSARVLAGSAARGSDAISDTSAAATLAASRKDVAEHEFAVRSVLGSLRPFTSVLDVSPHPFALKLPNLWHLASDVSGMLIGAAGSLELLAALHPTAAVGGEPTDAALALIARWEPFDRGRYAGPMGWVDASGNGEWAVALRCAQVEGATVRAFAGAGIVEGSTPERELAETELKFRPIRAAFGG